MFGRKKKHLPDNFEDMINSGDINAIKGVFDVCRIDARISRKNFHAGYTALHFSKVPVEIISWLVGQGLDVNTTSELAGYNTFHKALRPLETHLSDESPHVHTILNFGASVEPLKPGHITPLHIAAGTLNTDNIHLLIERGADVNATTDEIWVHKEYCLENSTPLNYVLAVCGCTGREYEMTALLKTVEVLFEAGALITPDMYKHVEYIVSHYDSSYNTSKDLFYADFSANEAAFLRLCEYFDVKPERKHRLHDGVSPITLPLPVDDRFENISEKLMPAVRKQFMALWSYLVPPYGQAETIQGEVIRITLCLERWMICNKLYEDEEFLKQFDELIKYMSMGSPLTECELAEIKQIPSLYFEDCAVYKQYREKRRVYTGKLKCNTNRLSELAVSWVRQNPNPITHTPTEV